MAVTVINLHKHVQGRHITPVADITKWQELCSDPKVADTANVLKPSGVTRSQQGKAMMGYAATTVLVALRYEFGEAVATPPTVKLVGIDGAGVPMLLADADGNSSFTLTPDVNADLQDAAGNAYSVPVEVDAQNCASVMALVLAALVGGGTVGENPGPAIVIKAK